MSCGCWVDDEAFGIANVREVREQADGFDESFSRFKATRYAKAQQSSIMTFIVFNGQGVTGMILQTWIINPGDEGVCLQEFGDFQGVFRVFSLSQG